MGYGARRKFLFPKQAAVFTWRRFDILMRSWVGVLSRLICQSNTVERRPITKPAGVLHATNERKKMMHELLVLRQVATREFRLFALNGG